MTIEFCDDVQCHEWCYEREFSSKLTTGELCSEVARVMTAFRKHMLDLFEDFPEEVSREIMRG